MGEVWKARDTRLERSVAVKMLPAELAHDAQLKLRFEREAKTISQLNHPHICSLFDVGENYLVMELLEGESLADRLARGALPLPDVFRYGAQIADALDRAHRAGVVHRDLKPGNVMITRGGAKLLDFGLAKNAGIEVSHDGATVQKPLTQEGTILGTFQYMAPEQLEGAEADARTDLFALGAVLYEMATGTRAFRGATKTSLIAAIVAAQPRPVSELQPLTPPALEHVIAKCLSKDPEDRWQSAHDVAEELRWIGASSVPMVAAARKPRRERLAWIAAVLALIAIAGWLATRPRATRGAVVEAAIPMDVSGTVEYFSGPPALSPDGKMLAYAGVDKTGRRALWVRALDRSTPQMLAGTEEATSPFWSPDGRFIAFFTQGALKKIAVSGGDADVIATSTTAGAGAWGRDGAILYSMGAGSPLFRVTAAGGAPSVVVDPPSIGAQSISWPCFLPDGKHVLFVAGGEALEKRNQAGVWLTSLDGSVPPRFIVRADSNVVHVAPGFLLYMRNDVLRAQPFDGKKLRTAGEPVSIGPVQWFSASMCALFTASDSGLLVYLPPASVQLSEIRLLNRKGEPLRKIGPGYYWNPRVSADGKRVVIDLSDPKNGKGDIWSLSLEDGSATRASFDARNETAPVMSPRGDAIAYMFDDRVAIARKQGGTVEVLDFPNGVETPTDWSADGQYLAILRFGLSADGDVLAWSIAGRKLIDVATTPAHEAAAVFSPDSRWMAYQSNETGRNEIYVQPFPPTGAKYQVSTAGGYWPRWRRQDEIAYVDGSRHIVIARVSATAQSFDVSAAVPLPITVDARELSWPEYDVAPDGNIVVNAIVRGEPESLALVVNWQQRLEIK